MCFSNWAFTFNWHIFSEVTIWTNNGTNNCIHFLCSIVQPKHVTIAHNNKILSRGVDRHYVCTFTDHIVCKQVNSHKVVFEVFEETTMHFIAFSVAYHWARSLLLAHKHFQSYTFTIAKKRVGNSSLTWVRVNITCHCSFVS